MTEEKILTKHPLGKSGKNISKQNYETLKKAILSALRNKELTHTELFNQLNKNLKSKFSGNISWYGETHTAEQPEASASPAESNSANSNQTPVAQGTHTFWETTAQGMTGDAGTTFTLVCPSGGSLHSVWGSDIYTEDSSICTAAVHAGLITVERGGTVTIELRPGREVYGTSQRNSVTTGAYGRFGRSFVFKSEINSR